MSSKDSETNIFSMSWPRSKDGYRTTSPQVTKKHVLGLTGAPLTTSILPKSDNWETYDPFIDCDGMAREFSDLNYTEGNEVDKKQALQFANKYGLLGLDQSDGRQKESLQDWNDKIFWLRGVFSLFDSKEQDAAENMFNNFSFSPQVALTIPRKEKNYQKSLVIKPTSLYAAIWIKASEEIVGGQKRKRCATPSCQNWFLERGNRLTCSNKCRIKKSRLIRLHSD